MPDFNAIKISTMNTVKLFVCVLFVWSLCLASCVPDTFELPDTTVIDPEINGTQVSIKSLQVAYVYMFAAILCL